MRVTRCETQSYHCQGPAATCRWFEIRHFVGTTCNVAFRRQRFDRAINVVCRVSGVPAACLSEAAAVLP